MGWIDKEETECSANNWFDQGQVRILNAMAIFLQLQSGQPKVTKLLRFCCMIQTILNLKKGDQGCGLFTIW